MSENVMVEAACGAFYGRNRWAGMTDTAKKAARGWMRDALLAALSMEQKPAAWAWDEREYNGSMSVREDDVWTAEIGAKVPGYEQPEKWIRNARPLIDAHALLAQVTP